jgi:hypothetical protein
MEILNKIQKELKAPKNQYNAFGKYKYRSCEDILEAVKPLLNNATLVINDEMVVIGERYYIKATATLTEADKSISATAYAREPEEKKGMDSAQITGATSSYARKYALNGLFLIDDTKDSDATNNETSEKNVNNVYKARQEAEKIKTLPELRKFYAKNKGLGKEFDSYIVELSKKLKEEPETEPKEEPKAEAL